MKGLLVFLIVVLVPLYLLYVYQNDAPLIPSSIYERSPTVHVGGVPVRVEVADTPAERMRGLSGRDSLDAAGGMLFIFDESDYHRVWMREMRFAIDVIWIDERLTVVDITRRLTPDTYPRQFEPSTPARFALEVNAQFAESFGISVGDQVELPRAIMPADLR